jgi:hypothetical protein
VSSISRIELYYTDGRRNLFLNGDQAAAGSGLAGAPLVNALGTTTWTNGELLPNGGSDPEFLAAGSQGVCFDGLGSPGNCEFNFTFDVDAVSFLYGGNSGGFTIEAYNGANVLVDSFSQGDTFSGQPAGPRTIAAPGIRRLRWFESVGGSFAGIDNVRIHSKPPCYADCDGVGGLTANDFVCFLTAYTNGLPYANCDGVGGLTANDFICFVTAYNNGCP